MTSDSVQKYYLGIAALVAASTCWAISFLLRKFIANDIGPIMVTMIASITATTFNILGLRIRLSHLKQSFLDHQLYFWANSFLSVCIGSTFMFLGLKYIDLSIAVVLEKLQPFYTLILAYFFLHESQSAKNIVFGSIAILLSILLVWQDQLVQSSEMHQNILLGASFVGIAAISWAAAGVLGRAMAVKDISPTVIATLRTFLGSLILLPLAFIEWHWGGYDIGWREISLSACIGVIGGSAGYVLYYFGLKFVEAGVASFVELITPIVGIVLSVLFLREQQTLAKIVLSAGILGCVALILWEKAKAIRRARLSTS